MDVERVLPIMRLARMLALRSTARFRLGAVLVRSGKPISFGYNRYSRCNKLSHKYFRFASVHAECDVLHRALPQYRKGAVLYIFRVKKRGEIGLSRPCNRCLAMMRDLGVRKIYYSTESYPYYKEEVL